VLRWSAQIAVIFKEPLLIAALYILLTQLIFYKFAPMAKAVKKKSAKEGSNIFHNIIAASVQGNPKPKKKEVKKKTN
jgi:hypothetical protein